MDEIYCGLPISGLPFFAFGDSRIAWHASCLHFGTCMLVASQMLGAIWLDSLDIPGCFSHRLQVPFSRSSCSTTPSNYRQLWCRLERLRTCRAVDTGASPTHQGYVCVYRVMIIIRMHIDIDKHVLIHVHLHIH